MNIWELDHHNRHVEKFLSEEDGDSSQGLYKKAGA
jgi:hypothetical protein